MSGARRHWPAVVTDTERDMSKELNTGEEDHSETGISTGGQEQGHDIQPDSVPASTCKGRDWWISEFKATLVDRASSRTVRATQRHPDSENQKKTVHRLIRNTQHNSILSCLYLLSAGRRMYHHAWSM